MCEWLLKAIGLWPLIYGHTSKLEQLVSLFLMVTCLSSLFFVILPSGHHILFVEKSTHMKVKLLGPVGYCVSSTIKYCYLGLKGPFLDRCIQHLEKDWKMVQDPRHRTIMLTYASIGRKLITVCAVFLYTGGLSYHTVMQLLSKERTRQNNTLRPLTYLGYDPFFDVQSSPTYEIVFTVHCVTAMVMQNVTTVAYSLVAIFVTHSCGQIQIQIAKLHDLVERKVEKKNNRDPIAVIVRDHVEVLR